MPNFINTDPVLLFIGIFYLVTGLSLLIKPKPWRDFVTVFQTNHIAILVSGMLALFCGLLITLFFQSYETPAHILLSIVGYIALVEATIMLLIPDLMRKFIASTFYDRIFKWGGFMAIIFGMLFLVL